MPHNPLGDFVICVYRRKGKCYAVDPPGPLYCNVKCPRYEPDYPRHKKIKEIKKRKIKKALRKKKEINIEPK